jgi:alkanesulfonate monooxygenase SsuD/methylene tetrahydromethanopterin reductase-like flavin-dependent oxidoreductase (luciferase family)
VLRGPVQLAKTLAAIDLLSGGRLVAGVGPGSSAADYAAAGIAFQERWPRFDEALRALRGLLGGDADGFEGAFYSTRGVALDPRRRSGPGRRSGSRAGARRPGCGGAPESFPTAIATSWLRVTEDRGEVERVLGEVLAPMLGRPVEELRAAPLLVGPAEVCAERLAALVAAGARRIFVWPLGDEVRQLELFRERVTTLVPR